MAVSAVSGQLAAETAQFPAFGTQIVKVFGVLGCLLGVLLLTCHILRKPWRGNIRSCSTRRLIQVLATHYLEPKKTLILVEVAGQQLLLASGPENLTLLTPLRAKPEVMSQSSRITANSKLHNAQEKFGCLPSLESRHG
ncbi:MAG: flagellar biosynthetic protein FliO [Desulfobacca sp.]|nr:flagellar biosynthetic protein FliO [Desulfobacca sp.]